MATETTNYKLIKDGPNEYYDIEKLNANLDKIDESIYSKVDKVAGKGLSTNDYGDAEKQKVADTKASLNSHLGDITNEQGRHGIRYWQEKLEIKVANEWLEFKSGSQYPVGNVSNFEAKGDDTTVELTWKDPVDRTVTDDNGELLAIAKWKGTKILRKVGSYPQNENDGVLVVDNGVRDQYATNGFIDTGLVNDTDYYYMAFPYTEEDVLTVDEANRVIGTPSEIKIYGVEIDENNSNPETSVVYTDDAVGFVPAKGNNGNFNWGSWEDIVKDEFAIAPVVLNNPQGTVNYYLNYDDYTQKATGGASNLTGSDGDVMIEFGQELWWKFTKIGSRLKIQLSTKQFDGAVNHAFDIEHGYNQLSFYPLTMLQVLFLLIFKNRDTQTALGRGYVDDNSNYLNTGSSNSRPFMYGETTGKQQLKFLGLEDYWGNRRQWVDGVFYDSSENILIGKNNFNDTGNGYSNFGKAQNTDGGYISKVYGTNGQGFIPAEFSGSDSTYYSDYGNLTSGRLPYFGGHRSNGSTAGGFYLNSDAASNAVAYFGGRCVFYSATDNKLYIGAYLGATVSGKLRSVSGRESENNKTIGAFRNLAKANN